MTRFGLSVVMGAAVLAASVATAAQADPIADFYKKKDINFIVASGAGGGYDTYGRVLMRSFNRHVPGHPNVVVRNMPGASGLRASNYLYNNAPRDGSVMGIVYNTNLMEPLLGNKSAHYDPLKMGWIGSMGKLQNVCVTWHTNPVKTFEELKKEKGFTVAATGATGNSAQMPRIFNTLLGTDIKVIAGYSTSGQRLALERGEVQGICGLGYSTLIASNPDWIIHKKINMLIQVGLHKSPNLPDTPMALNFIKDKHNLQVMKLLLIRQEWGRPIGAPPDVPAGRLAALRAAFNATLKDPKFVSEAKKAKLLIQPLTGQKMHELLLEAYDYPRNVVESASKLVEVKAKFGSCSKYTKDAKWCKKKKKKKKKM